jgi:formate dehydrogenase gamma subunit
MGALQKAAARVGPTLLFLVAGLPAPSAEPIKNSACLECHSDKRLSKTNAAGKEISLFVDAAKLAASAHKTNSCVSCHSDLTSKHPNDNLPVKPVDCRPCHERQSKSYGASAHGLALKAGQSGVPNCQDCHDSHEIMPPSSGLSSVYFAREAATCGQCHDQEAKDVAASVHGKVTAEGKREAPTCTGCHSEHKIEQLKGTSSLKISQDVCSKCHVSERMNTKFKLPANRVKTFFESYHGLAAQYGATLAANCSSCHGYHKILPSSDPSSTIHPSHLVATCGKCHPGASEKFAQGKVHVDAEAVTRAAAIGEQLNWWVRRLYLWLIFGVIGSMLVHNGLLLIRKLRAAYRSPARTILRMNRSQRLQHLVLLVSFIVLAITGFALKFSDSWLARALGSNEPFRRWTHRIAGVLLLMAGAYHLIYLLVTKDGRRLSRDFFPTLKDLKDVVANGRFLIGLNPKKPKFGRFGYAEKAEYWAVVWGTIIMGVTGLMIWFKLDVTRFLPRWAVDVSTTIHYYEAILACLAIVVWHFYHVIFDPDVYPINWACLDGRVSQKWLEEEHPLDPNAMVHTNESSVAAPRTVLVNETLAAPAKTSAIGDNGPLPHPNGHSQTHRGGPDFSI